MQRILSILILTWLAGSFALRAQPAKEVITESAVAQTIGYLASDALKGRGNGSPELLAAALYIGQKFRKAGLVPLPGMSTYFLPFRPFGGSKNIQPDLVTWNQQLLKQEQFRYYSSTPGAYPDKSLFDFTIIEIDTWFTDDILLYLDRDSTQADVLVWTRHKRPDGNFFPALEMPRFGIRRNILLAVVEQGPALLTLSADPAYYGSLAYNVAGMLPAHNGSGEMVVFSAHYDHEGVQGRKKDSIFNGANDNASGTTAVLLLADHFSRQLSRDRNIVFCAFAGEELGLKGSADFVEAIDAKQVTANINIEMIGVSQFGNKRVFITGERESFFPVYLGKKLRQAGLKVIPEKDPDKKLYERSDNYSFVQKGIMAHSIMSSDDDEKCYHQPCDEIRRINISHLTAVIRAIAAASEELVNGKWPGK